MQIVLRIVLTVLVLGALIFIHELGHFIMAKRAKMKVTEFALGMGPKILKKQGKETLYSLRLFPIGGFCQMEGEDEESENPDAFNKKSVGARISVILAGAFMNLLLGFVITVLLVVFAKALPSCTIAEFTEDAVSSSYGLQVDDTIIKVNNSKIRVYDDISGVLSRQYNKDTVDIVVLRNGEEVLLENVKFATVEAAEGLEVISRDFKVYRDDKTFGNIIKHSFFNTVSYVKMMYNTLYDLVSGNTSVKYLSGPVGISDVLVEAATYGPSSFFTLVALISINLAVVNLLPLPALDGGKFVFLVIEAIRKKPINQKYEAVIHFAGLVVLMLLMLAITFKDIFFPIT